MFGFGRSAELDRREQALNMREQELNQRENQIVNEEKTYNSRSISSTTNK